MPSWTTPATPGISVVDWCELSMWQLLVPMTMTRSPAWRRPAPGTPAWASMIAALTGGPGQAQRRGRAARVARGAARGEERPGILRAT